jgi:hypothetical protein
MRSAIVLSLAIFLSSGAAWGQAAGGFGAVTGVILDRVGNGMPDAVVVLSNEALGIERTLISTDDGVFNAATVVPFEGYRLKVTRKDFSGWDSDVFTVATGQKLSFEVILQAEEGADNATKAESIGGLRLVNDTISGLGAVNPPQQVADAPNSGRRLEALAPLAPAVVMADAAPGVMVFHGVPFSSPLLIDGISATNNYFLNRPGTPDPVTVDTLQDFYTASSNFLGEFGNTMGGFLDTGTRSGTTAFHGEVHDYFRNNSWQAGDRYSMGFDTRQRQHQGGVSVGGPLHGDNLFFFLNLQGLDRSGQGLNRITNPLIADPSGTRVLRSNCLATAAQCFVATRFLNSQMNTLAPLWEHTYHGLAKIDYRRSERNSFSFDAGGMNWHAPSLAETEDVAPNGGLIGDPILREQTRYFKAGWTATSSSQLTNDFRVGWFQDRVSESASAVPGFPTKLLGISIAGTTVGAPQPSNAVLPSEHRLQLVEIGSWTIGSHTLKIGAELSETRDYINSLSNSAGYYQYSSLTSFAQDFALTGLRSYTTFSQTFGNPVRTFNVRQLNAFVEDTYKATARLTLVYGLRYEKPRLPQPTQTNTTYFQTASITSPWLDLSPRVGASYAITSRTVLRAGFGFYYAPFPGQLVDALFLGNGLYQTSISVNPNQPGAPVFPQIIPSASKIPNGSLNVAYSTTKLANPYAQETSVALERSIGSSTTISLNVLHSRGLKLWTTQDFNQANPSSSQITSQTYTVDDASGQPARTYTTDYWIAKNNASFAHVYQIENGGSSWYNAAALQLHKRLSHGLGLEASYTVSHAIDNVGQQAPFGTAFSSTFNAKYTGDKGNSAFDQRHRAAIQWLWEPAVTKSKSVMSRYFLNGWQLSTLTTLASSQTFTPLVVVQGQQFSGVTMNYTSSLNGSGGWARVPFLPVNSLKTGPEYNVDARLARVLPITERVKATILFEGFNVFNMQYNTGVNTIAYTSQAVLPPGQANGTATGTLKPVPGLGAGNAAQGFPDGTNARRLQVAIRIVF